MLIIARKCKNIYYSLSLRTKSSCFIIKHWPIWSIGYVHSDNHLYASTLNPKDYLIEIKLTHAHDSPPRFLVLYAIQRDNRILT